MDSPSPVWHPETHMGLLGDRLRIRNRHFMAFLLVLAMVLMTTQISGCTTASLSNPDIYLVELQYGSFDQTPLEEETTDFGTVNVEAYTALNNYVNHTSMKARVGYFGLCIASLPSTSTSASTHGWQCSRSHNMTKLADKTTSASDDPLNLIYLLHSLQLIMAGAWLSILSVILVFVAFLLMSLVNVLPMIGFRCIFIMCIISHTVLLLAMVWLECFCLVVTSTVSNLSAKSVNASVGVTMLGLGWASYAFVTLCVIWLWIIVLKDRLDLNEVEASEFEEHEAEKLRLESQPAEPQGHHHLSQLERTYSDSTMQSYRPSRMPGYYKGRGRDSR